MTLPPMPPPPLAGFRLGRPRRAQEAEFREKAVRAGAVEVLVGSMRAHPTASGVQVLPPPDGSAGTRNVAPAVGHWH